MISLKLKQNQQFPWQIKGTKEHKFGCFALRLYHRVASSGVLSGTLSKANAGVGARVQVQVPETTGDCSGYVSNEKKPGCLGYIGDYTAHLHRDYNKP